MSRMAGPEFLLTLTCPERVGIVHAVSGFLVEHGCNILDNRQYSDAARGRLFMRVHVQASDVDTTLDRLRVAFAPVGTSFDMQWEVHAVDERPRLLLMVSRFGHCLNDLLYRWRAGALKADIIAVVSNHTDFEELAGSYGVAFHHLPVTPDTKFQQEARLLEIVEQDRIDLVVLARYMQILSDDLCGKLAGAAINIHHSFLPSFRGAKPYHQAYERGVKLIGATAHYVSPELDEGPIIDQEVTRVDHTLGPDELTAAGRDVECLALAHAVQWHVERRVLLNGNRTVVFR
jgi:formyltetrahydrofolate deformylase